MKSAIFEKASHSENSGHEALGIVEEVGSAITTVQPGDVVIVHLLTVMGNVMLAVLVLTERVITIWATQTGLLVSNQNMSASTMLTGL